MKPDTPPTLPPDILSQVEALAECYRRLEKIAALMGAQAVACNFGLALAELEAQIAGAADALQANETPAPEYSPEEIDALATFAFKRHTGAKPYLPH
jgi:hypothetical protein